jgi:hypothetical protein
LELIVTGAIRGHKMNWQNDTEENEEPFQLELAAILILMVLLLLVGMVML